ncbi:MAG TPA: hypothetical protein VER32_12180 [Pyrinomonadaceae bacterium]|nr:hypothetical protein [Pyrinomonadaceae bacterium]
MSHSLLRTLPAVALALLFVAASGQRSASAQTAPQVTSAAHVAAAPARLSSAEREFFGLNQQTGAWERPSPVAPNKGDSRITKLSASDFADLAAADALDADALDDDAARDRQQPPAQTNSTYTPMTSGQKMRRAFKGAFLSPAGYVRTAISAAITEAGEEDLPHKETDDRVADGLSRFAIKFTSRATRTLLGSGVYPIIFKQDPRYERSTSKNPLRRALHAASRVFVTRGDNGRIQPNYSRFAGAFSASALSNIWEQSTPGRDRIGWDATGRRFLSTFPDDILNNILFREFLPDLIRKVRRR